MHEGMRARKMMQMFVTVHSYAVENAVIANSHVHTFMSNDSISVQSSA